MAYGQTDEIADPKKENHTLRRLLCLHHGCPQSIMYFDDGELQCTNLPKHMIDFRRMPANEIEYRLMNEEGRAFFDRIKESKYGS